ncbi:MAG: HAMP domain-containing sensor histidine kinase [Candidatus Woesebacteria bacterium]|jgi:signal transduction histidine kinase
MIKSAILRLTAWYLGIIMVLSIGFSVAMFQIYKSQLNDELRAPSPSNVTRQLSQIEGYDIFRQQQVDKILSSIAQGLILLNAAMLGAGGAVSYFLARKNLQPVADAMEAQSRFTADASHELRTPLTAMQTEIEVALREKDLSVKQAKALLQSNLEEVAKLKALSEGLLKLAHSTGKELPLQVESVDKIVTEAINRVIPSAQLKDISIDNAVKPYKVNAEAQSLTELFVILIDNAIKYSDLKSEITVVSKTQNKTVHISVIDRGCGIKASDLPHIFDRFYRSDPSRSKEKTDGYGLGLSIAHKIIEAHKGSIEVRSLPGKGATFTVKMPRVE